MTDRRSRMARGRPDRRMSHSISPSPSPTSTHVIQGEECDHDSSSAKQARKDVNADGSANDLSPISPKRSGSNGHRSIDLETHRQHGPTEGEDSREGLTDLTANLDRPPTPVSIHQHISPPSPDYETSTPTHLQRTVTDTSRPYSSFSQSTKYLIVAISGLAGIFSPISSNIFVPAIPTLAGAFNRSEQDISLAVTIYLVFQAITPSFFGAMSDSYGRRPIYIGTLVVYLGANIGLALIPTSAYWLLLFLRALQATGGSAVISIGAGCVADVAEPRERGKYIAFFQLGAMAGPAFGPLLGGIFAQTLGWRSIFWFLTISTGVVLVPLIFFMPETLRSLVGDGSIPPPALCMSPPMLLQKRKMEKELREKGEEKVHVDRPPRKPYRPWTSFLILLNPEITLSFIAVSFQYLEFYCILTLYSTALRDSYGLNDLKIGLAYLSNGFGIMVSVMTNGKYVDYNFRKEEKRVGGDYRKMGESFRLEYARFRSIIPFSTVFLIASIAQGWCLQVKAPLGVTITMGFFVGLGSSVINVATLYGMDVMPGQGGAVSASLNLVRCLFGAVGTAVIQLLYNAIGAGWTATLLSGMSIAVLPLFPIIAKWGPRWREDRKARAGAKAQKKAENAAHASS